MSLDQLLNQTRQSLPTLQNSLSPFTTPQEAPSAPTPAPAPRAPVPQLAPVPAPPTPQNNPLEPLQQRSDAALAALSFAPSSNPTIESLALGPILNGGQGGRGSPQADITRALDLIGHGISNGTSSIPSGGPTSSVNYADLPGMYGKLVSVGGSNMLQQGAARSLKGVLPYSAILGGSYRTYAQQAADYAKDPSRFAPPGKSLHEYGLAIDVNSGFLSQHPDVRKELLARGWYQERPDEPWHFSYGVYSTPPTQSSRTPRSQRQPQPPSHQRQRRPSTSGQQR